MLHGQLPKLISKINDITSSFRVDISVRTIMISFIFLTVITVIGFIIGVYIFKDIPPPIQKLSGKTMAHIDIKRHVEEKILPIPTTAIATPTTDAENGLYEVTSFGSLPIIRTKDNVTPFNIYRAKFTKRPQTVGIISIVMVDFGLSATIAKEATLALPPAITFTASPYADDLQQKITIARSYGHEVWMKLPIESKNNTNNDMGPVTILTGLKRDNNLIRMKSIMGRATGYTGIIIDNANHFDTATDNLDAIITESKIRGIGFIQSSPYDTITMPITTIKDLPTAKGNTWIDESHDKNDIIKELNQLIDISIKNGVAIGFMHASPALFPLLNEWQKNLNAKNIELAPLSYATNR